MPIPTDVKERAIYHTILSDMHRMQGTMLNLQTIEAGEMEKSLRAHFTREQNVTLGKLAEWRQRRPQVYEQASEDFKLQVMALQ